MTTSAERAVLSRRRMVQRVAAATLAAAGSAVLSACGSAPAVVATDTPTQPATPIQAARPAPTASPAAASTPAPTLAPSAAGKTPVVFYHSFNAAQQPRVESILVSNVKRDLPGIDLQITPTKATYTDLQILIAGGSQPDVAMNNGLNPLGMFTDPTTYIARDKLDLGPYNPILLDFLKWGGVLWSLPASVGGNGPMWAFNKTRFDNAGIPYPPDQWNDPTWTWDELVKRASQLTTKQGDKTTYGFGPLWAFHAQPRPWGTQWIKLDLQTVTADTPEMHQAFTVWQDLFCKYGVLPKPSDKSGYNTTDDTILAGASAIKPIGAWNYAQYVQSPNVTWAFAPVPKGTVTACDQTYFGVSIVAGAKHPDGAWQFARWLATTPDYTLVRQVPPALPVLFDKWLPAVFGKQVTERRAHLIKDGLAFAAPSDGLVYHPKQKQMISQVNPMIEQVSNCALSPADMLRQAQSQLSALAAAP